MDTALANELRRLMAENGYTQTTWAERLGLSQPAVANFLAEDSNPRLQTLVDYAAAIDVDVEIKLHTRR